MAKPRTPRKTNGAVQKSAEVTPAEVTPIDTVAAAEVTPAEAKPRIQRTVNKPETFSSPAVTNATKQNGGSQISSKLVPINVEDEIRQLAYLFSERRGFIPGHENDDWLAAEHEVLQRYHQHSA
jgi:hypothetical protein